MHLTKVRNHEENGGGGGRGAVVDGKRMTDPVNAFPLYVLGAGFTNNADANAVEVIDSERIECGAVSNESLD